LKEEVDTPRLTREIAFATSNDHKYAEVVTILKPFGITVTRLKNKGTEIQSDDLREIASFASKIAYTEYACPLIVEDAGLFIDGLNGFPGPYSAYVFRTLGLTGLVRVAANLESRWAVFRSAVAYRDSTDASTTFEGAVRGWLVHQPSGTGGFGFDPVFAPEGFSKTYAELPLDEKCQVSHRGAAMKRFASWFLENR
jgi:XTP/dITP diphosphohydrolase